MPAEHSLQLSVEAPLQEQFSFAHFKQHLAENKKAVLIFTLLFTAAALLLGNIALMSSGWPARALQVFAFLGLGYGLMMVLQKKLNLPPGVYQTVYIIFLSLVVGLSLAVLFKLRGFNWPLMIAASTLSFLLPYTIIRAWLVYTGLAVSEHRVWQYIEGSVSKQSVVSFNNIPIRMKFLSQPSAKTETVVSFNAPIRMKLGTVFYHIIQQQNEGRGRKIEHADGSGAPFYWEFYSEELGGLNKQFFDPEESLVENNIKPNLVIIAQRVIDRQLQHHPDFSNEPTNN